MAGDRNYWVWVTGPDYYMDEDGSDRTDLEPGSAYVPGGWWTCHKDTEKGDLVLLYRTKPKKDIAYLIETRSDAYSLLGKESADEQGWDYGCDFEVVEKFSDPLTLEEMKADRALDGWSALSANFHRRSWSVPPDIWDHLWDRLIKDTSGTKRRLREATRGHTLERKIEDCLASHLTPFRRHGLRLRFIERQHICHRGGRADLVCFDTHQERYVVIELKPGLGSRDAVAQLLSYLASIAQEDEFRARRRPLGVLVGDRLDNEASGMIDDNTRLVFVPLHDLGPCSP